MPCSHKKFGKKHIEFVDPASNLTPEAKINLALKKTIERMKKYVSKTDTHTIFFVDKGTLVYKTGADAERIEYENERNCLVTATCCVPQNCQIQIDCQFMGIDQTNKKNWKCEAEGRSHSFHEYGSSQHFHGVKKCIYENNEHKVGAFQPYR